MLYSGKDLRKLIIPLIIEQILAIAVGMADTIMVSAAGEAAVQSFQDISLGKRNEKTHVSRHGRSYCSPHCSRSLFPLFL